MNIDFRKLISTILLPAIILSCSYFLIPQISQSLPSVMQVILPYLPFVIFIAGMGLSWIFHHSREFNLFLLFTIIYISFDNYLWREDLKVDYKMSYLLIVTLIPVNYLINFLSRERGVINRYGVRRFIILAVQLYCIAWLLEHPHPLIKHYFTYSLFDYSLLKTTSISQPLLVFIIITGLVILYKLLKTPTTLIAGILSSLIAISLAAHFYQQPETATLFLIVAGLLLVLSITINAYSLAYLDELTSLPSRRALMQNFSTLGKNYCVAMVDVDHFKKFNDKYGHDIGDQVLKKLANQLRQVRGGKAFRYGGEEFTVIFPNKNLDEARVFCNELCKNVANSPFLLRNKGRPKSSSPEKIAKKKQVKQDAKPLTITISIGLAERTAEHQNPDQVIKQADQALYKAKKSGRNRVAI